MSADFRALRETMVDSQVRTQDVTDYPLVEALRAFPRESVTPADKSWLAYADAEVEYAPGRWMLRPRDVAKLLQALKPRAGERALALSAPYAGGILERLGLSVIHQDAAETIGGAWDVIVCEGAVTTTAVDWKNALAAGGRLGVVERTGPVGQAMLYLRTEHSIGSRSLFNSTPPVLAGFEPKRSFVF
jgi:protein-L-isoaspartate(D-aspartate) O-methyltransferase